MKFVRKIATITLCMFAVNAYAAKWNLSSDKYNSKEYAIPSNPSKNQLKDISTGMTWKQVIPILTKHGVKKIDISKMQSYLRNQAISYKKNPYKMAMSKDYSNFFTSNNTVIGLRITPITNTIVGISYQDNNITQCSTVLKRFRTLYGPQPTVERYKTHLDNLFLHGAIKQGLYQTSSRDAKKILARQDMTVSFSMVFALKGDDFMHFSSCGKRGSGPYVLSITNEHLSQRLISDINKHASAYRARIKEEKRKKREALIQKKAGF